MEEKNEIYRYLVDLSKAIRTGYESNVDKVDFINELIGKMKEINGKTSLEISFDLDTQIYFMDSFLQTIIYSIVNQSNIKGDDGNKRGISLLFQIYRLFSTFHSKNYQKVFENVQSIFQGHENKNFFSQNKQGETKTYIDFNEDYVPKLLYKEGDKVDILIENSKPNTSIDDKVWVQGVITLIEEYYYLIQYIKDKDFEENLYYYTTEKIRPFESETKNYKWKTNLNKNEKVDIYNGEKWFPGTIIDISSKIESNGLISVKYQVGYRLYKKDINDEIQLKRYMLYFDDNTTRNDENGEYIGFSKEKDEYIYHYSQRIQKFDTYSNIQFESKVNPCADFNESLREKIKVKNDCPKKVIFGKEGEFSYNYALLLIRIEKIGDFEKFIQILNDHCSYDEFYTIITILHNSLNYIDDSYINANKTTFVNSYKKLSKTTSDPQQLNNLRELVFSFFMKAKIWNEEELNMEKNEINLVLSLNMIKSNKFDDRKKGIKELDKILGNSQDSQKEILANLIQKEKIINEIFGPNYHSQIISMTNKLIKLLMKYKKLGDEELKLIWSCTKKGDLESKINIIKIFENILDLLGDDLLGALLDQIINSINIKPEEIEIDFVKQLASKTKTQKNKMKICDYFCQSLFNLNSLKKNNIIFQKFNDLIQDDDYITKIIEIYEKNMKKNKYPLICNTLIIALIEKFIQLGDKSVDVPYKCKSEALNNYFKTEELLKIIEQNFKDYVGLAKETFKNKTIEDAEQIKIDNFTHDINVRCRLQMLLILIENVYPNYNFISLLRELLIKNPVFSEDKKYFFLFCRKYLETKKTTKEEVLKNIQLEIFNIFLDKAQSDITCKTFNLFMKLFFEINSDKLSGKIISKTDNDDTFEIKLNEGVKDIDIKGFQRIWELIIEGKDETIIKKLINIINQISSSKDIMNRLYDHSTIPTNLVDRKEVGEYILKYYNLWKLYFIETEKNVVIDAKSHLSLLKNYIIKIPLEIQGIKRADNYLELFYDNTSLNEIKEYLMHKYRINMKDIKANLIEENGKNIELDYTYNNKSLREILIDKFGAKIIFTKISRKKECLMDENELSTKFKKILKKLLEMYSSEGKLDHDCWELFFTSEKKEYNIKDIYEHYEKKDGEITEEKFYDYFLYLVKNGDIDFIFKILDFMEYDNNLEFIDDIFKLTHEKNDEVCRYILGNNDYLEKCFDIYIKHPESDFDIIFFFSTNKNIYYDILKNFNTGKDLSLYEEIFSNNNLLIKQIYYLIIIESIFQDVELHFLNLKEIFTDFKEPKISSPKYEPYDSININEKIQFIIDFVKSGNYINFINYIISFLERYKKQKEIIVKRCLLKSLKIITIIYQSCYNYKKSNNKLIEGKIYYLDFCNINNVFKEKDDINKIIYEYSYTKLTQNLMEFSIENKENEKDRDLLNECFELLIKILFYNKNITLEFLSREKNEKNLDDIIKSSLKINDSPVINIIVDFLGSISKAERKDSRLVKKLNDILESILGSMEKGDKTENIYISNSFINYFKEINKYISQENKDKYKASIKCIVQNLKQYILNKNTDKNMKEDIFIIYIELINELIQDNPELCEELSDEKEESDKSLPLLVLKFILLDENKGSEERKKTLEEKEKEFVLLEKKKDENFLEIKNQMQKVCMKYIINNYRNIEVIKKIISLNFELKVNKDIKNNYNNQKINDNYQEKQECGHVGLYNLGATCYMNSILQQLYMIPTFRYAIMESDDQKDTNSGIKKYSAKDDNVLHQLQIMYSYLTLSKKKFFIPINFCNSFKNPDGHSINTRIQQDSQEFYNYFCDTIEKSLKETKYKYILEDVLTGKTCSLITCNLCKHSSYKFEDFYCLSVEIKNFTKLQKSLEKLIEPEIIEDYKCSNCKTKVTINKRLTLAKLPNILVIHLKRFSINYEYNQTEKINSFFEFPKELNLKEFCIENVQKEDNDEDDIYLRNNDYYSYVLKGVNVHSGHANGGHYYSIINLEREGQGNTMKNVPFTESKWVKFNDSNLSDYDLNDIPNECYGSKESATNAYLLIYERVKKTPIKVILNNNEKEKESKIIEFDENTKNATIKKYDLSRENNVNVYNENDLYKLTFFDKNIKEYFKYIPYYDIKPKAPKEVYKQIMKDNNNLNYDNENTEISEIDFRKKEILNEFIKSDKFIHTLALLNNMQKTKLLELTLDKIAETLKQNNLTRKMKKDLLNELNYYLKNLVYPLINSNKKSEDNITKIKDLLLSEGYISLIFNIESDDMDNSEIFYKCLKKMIETNGNDILNSIYEIWIEITKNCNKNFNITKDNMKYFYSLMNDIIKDNNELITKSIKDNLLFYNVLQNIEKSSDNCAKEIIKLLKTLLKGTKDYIKITNCFENKEDKINNEPPLYNKNGIKELINIKVVKIFFDNDREFLNLLIPILQASEQNYKGFCKDFNTELLSELIEYTFSKNKIEEIFSLLYNIISIKDDSCLERMKDLLGYPSLVVLPKKDILTENEQNVYRWPLFGESLIKYNNNKINTKIYKYTNYCNNGTCILSYLFEEDKKYALPSNSTCDINTLKYQLIQRCFLNGGNYHIFKYLFLLPATSLQYNNLYEELKSDIPKDKIVELSKNENIEQYFIEKVNYEISLLNEDNSKNEPKVPNEIKICSTEIEKIKKFRGCIPDYLPGTIRKKVIEILASSEFMNLIRIEYFTEYKTIDEVKNQNVIQEINDNKVKDEKEDFTSEKDTNNFEFHQVSHYSEREFIDKVINDKKRVIIQEDTNKKIICSYIRYMLDNKKPINNDMTAYLKFSDEKVDNNVFIPRIIKDSIDRYNYVNF